MEGNPYRETYQSGDSTPSLRNISTSSRRHHDGQPSTSRVGTRHPRRSSRSSLNQIPQDGTAAADGQGYGYYGQQDVGGHSYGQGGHHSYYQPQQYQLPHYAVNGEASPTDLSSAFAGMNMHGDQGHSSGRYGDFSGYDQGGGYATSSSQGYSGHQQHREPDRRQEQEWASEGQQQELAAMIAEQQSILDALPRSGKSRGDSTSGSKGRRHSSSSKKHDKAHRVERDTSQAVPVAWRQMDSTSRQTLVTIVNRKRGLSPAVIESTFDQSLTAELSNDLLSDNPHDVELALYTLFPGYEQPEWMAKMPLKVCDQFVGNIMNASGKSEERVRAYLQSSGMTPHKAFDLFIVKPRELRAIVAKWKM
ncbi:hypothetical protein CBS101457_000258 [Exobasidium rhododendri]|nr:hypothetical protein CBS101457_000258 [Exobasidium rhododendri]